MKFYGKAFQNRLLLGTAGYPAPTQIADSVRWSGAEIVTVSLRRESPHEKTGHGFWNLIKGLGVQVLPNTAGCSTAQDAIITARMAREVFETDWIKLEVIGDEASLHPDPFGLLEAARILCREGFKVFPYMTDDVVLAQRLLEVGCEVLMPWGAPIGTARGLNNPYALTLLRRSFPEVPLIVDAGIGRPSHAAQAMELGCDAVLINTAIAKAGDSVKMAQAMAQAVIAGRAGYEARFMAPQDAAQASSPVFGGFASPWSKGNRESSHGTILPNC